MTSIRILSTVCMVLLTSTAWGQALQIEFAEEPTIPTRFIVLQQEEPEVEEDEDLTTSEELSAPSQQESLRPQQSREIGTTVSAVDTSMVGLGTGKIPEADQEEFAMRLPLPDGYQRGVGYKQVEWRASELFHYPLYFEEAMLERHGHDRWGYLQPVASGIRFYSTIAISPYLHTLQSPCECRYALGHYRPGTCAPVLKDHVPYDRHAAAVQTLTSAARFWASPL